MLGKRMNFYSNRVILNRYQIAFQGGFQYCPRNRKLDVFEGPFDLLLTLLERNKLEITDIRISLIADQYLDVLKEHFNMEMASEFLVMASWLMHLKSKRLLPKQEKEEEEEITEEELARRLAQYKK